jgi:hypothetical protein
MKIKIAVVICGVFAFAIFTTWALAQGNSPNTYAACVNNSSGTIHILSEGETCSNNEVLIQWNQASTVGAHYVNLTDQNIKWEQSLRAFVPTNSTSDKCLVTLAETRYEISALTTFCGYRQFDGQDGILVSVFYPPWVDLQDGQHTGFIVSLTVFHEGATWYGPPEVSPE